jgi:hypothetical protein
MADRIRIIPHARRSIPDSADAARIAQDSKS